MSDVLNTEVSDVLAASKRALRWWWAELAEVFAPLARPGRRRAWPLLAERGPDGRWALRDAAGVPVPIAAASGRAAAVVLAPGEALVRVLPMPDLPERDLRRMVELGVDRLIPFPAESAAVALDVAELTDGDGRRAVRLAAAPLSTVEQVLRGAEAAGIAPAALLARGEGAEIDLLPSLAPPPTAQDRRVRAVAWAAMAALLVLNVALWIWRDVRDLHALQDAVAQRRPVAERVERLRRTLRGEAARVRARVAARAAAEPLRTLDALSRALPADAWVQRLTLEGGRVRIAGRRREGSDVAAALARSGFPDARPSGDAPTSPDGFDVTASAPPAVARR
jgi:general secretion pathway protein L